MTTDVLRPVYDVCIIGAGMIGSSAARYAVKMKHYGRPLTVCLVGPEEPKDRHGQTIFSSHYDEGRITRTEDSDPVQATLASRSVSRYRDIERETGVHFYEEVGCLHVGTKTVHPSSDVPFPAPSEQARRPKRLSSTEFQSKFPYLNSQHLAAKDMTAILEVFDAGYINPRKVCLAQQMAAERGGCDVIRDVVSDVSEVKAGAEGQDSVLRVTTDRGLNFLARKVLVSTGAFTEFRRLLPPGVQLDLQPMSESVIFAELSSEDLVKLKDMPSMVIRSSAFIGPAKLPNDHAFGCYVLPPIKYPDGKVYMKMGPSGHSDRPLLTPADVVDWFRNPAPEDDRRTLHNIFRVVFPDVIPLSIHYDTCVSTRTPSRRPYIDLITPQLAVALGGNGYAAKSCDEIGRLAIQLLVNGMWVDDLPRDVFKANYRSTRINAKL